MKRTKGAAYNILLVKDDVGRAKPNTRRLPPDHFTFGKKEIRDIEDAGMGKQKEVKECLRDSRALCQKTTTD